MNALCKVGSGSALALVTGSTFAQNGPMMNGGMWGFGWMGGYGGYWMPLLVLAVVVGLVVWVVKQKK